jgi:uncharacterized coiled-coil DUF342 family protein
MAKCEHHDEYLKLHDTIKDRISMVERALEDKVHAVDKKTDTVFRKLDVLRDEVDEQGKDHRETATYVKQLYKRFDELTSQMQGVVTKLDNYITTMSTTVANFQATLATNQANAKNNSAFNKRGKDLVFEIIKWLVLMGIGAALFKSGTTP